MRKRAAAVYGLVALVAFGASGCGTGWIRFEEIDARFASAQHGATTPVLGTIDCQDYHSGEQPFGYPYIRKKILYVTTCTKDGAAIPWKVLGVFHAAAYAFDKWPQYSREVAEKAGAQGCPALLVRKAPPTSGQEAQAIGALCVDPDLPSGVHGPMRLAVISGRPLQVLADGEPTPSI